MERLFEGSRIKIMTATLLLDTANKIMHILCHEAHMLHRGLVDTIFHNKTLLPKGYKPWELTLTLKIQQLLASNIVYLQSEDAV